MRRVVAALCIGALLAMPACTSAPPGPDRDGETARPKDAKGSGGTADQVVATPGDTGGAMQGGESRRSGLPITVSPAPEVSLELVPVATDAFTMDLPAGWEWETVGEYTTFGIRAHDPAHPGRQLFFYSKMEPFIKSEDARAVYQASAAMIPGQSYAQMYANAPTLSPVTTQQFFTVFDQYTAFAGAYGIDHTFTSLADLEIVEVLPLQTPIGDYTADDAVVRGLFTTEGVSTEGLFAASVFDGGPYLVDGVDTSPLSVYNVMGIAAPGDEFAQLEEVLARSLASFAYTDAYVAAAGQHVAEETGAMLAYAATMTAAYDSYNAAWAARQTSYDAVSQQRSDATLGYDRLYDPATGEVFRAESGFYATYDAARDDYANAGLLLVPSDDTDLWTRPLAGYISAASPGSA